MSGSLEIPASPEAREAFADAVERDPARPQRALASSVLPPAVRAEVELLVAAYERGVAIERALCAQNGEIDRVVAEVARSRAAPVSREIPERIGDYAVTGVLSRTARSVVLAASQERPIQREVALKLLFEDASDPDIAARVELERQILAALEHPNIARIYDFGIDKLIRPYIVMERVRDGVITEWCAAHGAAAAAEARRDARIAIFLQVVEAVRYAHARGVLHCDLKPANILIQELEGAPYAKVIDFGIARAFGGALAERAALVELSQSVGTLLSMSPEALKPGGAVLDVRTDVFGLGLVLFELLSGRPPRVAREGDLAGTVRDLLEQPVPRLSAVMAGAPTDLDAILAKACACEPAARYETVAALGQDLRAFLDGHEVSARRRSMRERVRRTIVRRWKVAAALGALLAIGVGAPLIATAPARARLGELRAQAGAAVDSAQAMRNDAGRADEHAALVEQALDASIAALELGGRTTEALELRASALEEAILPRLAHNDHTSVATVKLVQELVAIREEVLRDRPSARAKERLSIALAYQLDTVRGTDAYPALEARQLALDEELFAENPDVRVFADNLCWTYQRVYDPMWRRGQREQVISLLRRSGEIGEMILAKHGADARSLHTAAAAAVYVAYAERAAGDVEAMLAATGRARAHGMALLRMSPNHRLGAGLLIRAAEMEASVRLEDGDAREVAAMLKETIDASKAGSAYDAVLSTAVDVALDICPVAARAWIAAGEPARAEESIASFSRALEQPEVRDWLHKWHALTRYTVRRDMLRVRVSSLRGDHGAARDQMQALLSLARGRPAGERIETLTEIAFALGEFDERQSQEPAVSALIRETAEAVDRGLSEPQREEAGEALREVLREGSPDLSRHLGRLATGILVGRLDTREKFAAAAAELRAVPGTSMDLEWALRALERSAARRGTAGR
jgi:serine/threonine protein kinase